MTFFLVVTDFKGGPEPSNLEDLCLVNVSVKYFSKLCFGAINIQPELKYLKTILEVSTSSFQRAKTWEYEFGRVTSILFIFTGSKMDTICKGINYKYFDKLPCQISSTDRGASVISRSCVHARSGVLCCDIYTTPLNALYQARTIILGKTLTQKYHYNL